MTALPIIDDTTWLRMPWHARQKWLQNADRVRRELQAAIEASMRSEAARAAHRRHIHSATIAAAQAILDELGPDPDGPAHLAALEWATRPKRTDRTTPEYRARNAQRQRDLRARRSAEQGGTAA